ncbi:MAG: hypothetical protein KJZ85_04835 [Rhodobacteraceae bacterium]|jgi:hypothetical protein|nr:hypothetical protein [Paracoccaceae bacterium]
MLRRTPSDRHPGPHSTGQEDAACGLPDPLSPDDPGRGAWASEALCADLPDFGPFADRLAILGICNPRALEGDAPGPGRLFGAVAAAIGAGLLTYLTHCRRLLAVHSGEPSVESSATGARQDR